MSESTDDHAAQLWRELVESSVECELCNEPYDETDDHLPRLLVCGHTFCQSCLEDWSSHATASVADDGSRAAVIECPTCRRMTRYDAAEGARSLPKNFELLRVRQEMESQTQYQLEKLKQAWLTQVMEKERLAQEAEQHAMMAQRESVQAEQRAIFLAKQVEINEQEKRQAQELAEEARRKALHASQQAEALQAETELLKQRLHHEALQLQRVKNDANSAAAVAAELHSRAEELQQQVEYVRAQLSLHSGRCDPSKLVVLVVEPTTVGSWLMPYTRYAVISIATSDASKRMDPYRAAKMWTTLHQVAEPSSSVKVYRRYSDFVWLHHELHRKYPFELVPSIPAKQLFFNQDKEFIGERMRSLQAFVREILHHSVLAVTEEVRAFLLSTTEELEKLRNASRLSDDNPGDSYLREVEASEAAAKSRTNSRSTMHGVISPPVSSSSTAPLPPSTSSSASAAAVSTSKWAWGAMSAITSSAAKLVTSTGSALTSSISGVASTTSMGSSSSTSGSGGGAGGTSSLDDVVVETSLSSSLTVDLSTVDGPTRADIERRRKYIEITQAHQSVIQKGSQLSRAQRQYSHHLHRLCEYMHQMETLDQQHQRRVRDHSATTTTTTATTARSRMEQSTYTARQVEEDARSCLEQRSFEARASDMFSALSLATRNDAECMEYALLEVSRMQTLRLGAIEDAFARIRTTEDALRQTTTAATGSSMTSSNHTLDLHLTTTKPDDLQATRRSVMDKVSVIDPSRSKFVLETLQKNAKEMHKLAHARRRLHEDAYQQVVAAAHVRE